MHPLVKPKIEDEFPWAFNDDWESVEWSDISALSKAIAADQVECTSDDVGKLLGKRKTVNLSQEVITGYGSKFVVSLVDVQTQGLSDKFSVSDASLTFMTYDSDSFRVSNVGRGDLGIFPALNNDRVGNLMADGGDIAFYPYTPADLKSVIKPVLPRYATMPIDGHAFPCIDLVVDSTRRNTFIPSLYDLGVFNDSDFEDIAYPGLSSLKNDVSDGTWEQRILAVSQESAGEGFQYFSRIGNSKVNNYIAGGYKGSLIEHFVTRTPVRYYGSTINYENDTSTVNFYFAGISANAGTLLQCSGNGNYGFPVCFVV